MHPSKKLSALVSSIALIGILTLPAHASLPEQTDREPVTAPIPITFEAPSTEELSPEATADTVASLSFEKPEVSTEPAPPPPPPPIEEIVQSVPVVVPVAPPAPAPAPVAPKPAPVVAPAPAPAPVPVAAPSGRAAVASAALGQIGVMQDCTMLVTNSLRSIGINFHGWPHEYFSLGTQIPASEAQPGDLIYYLYGSAPGSLAHIAVYIGNGKAVHGGWNGNETRIFSVNVGSGPVFIRLR